MKVNLKMSPAIATSVTFTDEEEVTRPRLGINYEGHTLYTPMGLGWDKSGLYSRVYGGRFKALWGSVSKRDDPVLDNPVRSITAAWNGDTKQMHLSFDEELFELLSHDRYGSMHAEFIQADRYDTLPGATTNVSNSGVFKITDSEMTIDFSNSSVPEGATLLTANLYVHLESTSNDSDFNVFFFFGGAKEQDKKCTSQVNVFEFYNTSNESFWSNPSRVTFTYNNGVFKITSLGTHFDQYLTFQYDDIRFVYVDPYTEDVTVFSLNEEHEINTYAFSAQAGSEYLGLNYSSCWFTLFHTTEGEWVVMSPVSNTSATYVRNGQFKWTSLNTTGWLPAYCVPVEMAQKVKAQTGINLIRDE